MTKKEREKLKEMYETFSEQVIKNQVDIMSIMHKLQGRISELDRIHGRFMKEYRTLIPKEIVAKDTEQ